MAIYLGAAIAVIDVINRKTAVIDDIAASVYMAAPSENSFEKVEIGRPHVAFFGRGDEVVGIAILAFKHRRPLKAGDSIRLFIPAGAQDVREIGPSTIEGKDIDSLGATRGKASLSDFAFSPEVPSHLTAPVEPMVEGSHQVVSIGSDLPFVISLCETDPDTTKCPVQMSVFAVMFSFPASYTLVDGLSAKVLHVRWNPALGLGAASPPWGSGKVMEDAGLDGGAIDRPAHVTISTCSCAFSVRDVEGGGFSDPGPESRNVQEGERWKVEWTTERAIEFPVEGSIPRWLISASTLICLPLALGIPIVDVARRMLRRRKDRA